MEIAKKSAEYQKQGDPVDIADARAENWAKGQAALHAPDQTAGGKANNFSGLGNSRINSSIGAQWKSRVEILDNYINKKSETLPGSSELDIEFVLK